VKKSCLAGQVCAKHRKRSTKAPPQLGPIDLLPESSLPVLTKLVTKPKEGILERQVEAMDRSALQFFDNRLVVSPPLLPRGAAGANIFREAGNQGDADHLFPFLCREEWVDSILKVGKEENLALGERLHKAGLVYTIE